MWSLIDPSWLSDDVAKELDNPDHELWLSPTYLRVEFHPDHMPGLIKLAGMEIELSQLLGKKVDLRTAQDLSIHFRDDVLREAKEAYAET